jgi:hypothetical protein
MIFRTQIKIKIKIKIELYLCALMACYKVKITVTFYEEYKCKLKCSVTLWQS